MKFFKIKFFILLFSIFISILLLIFFKPILTAKHLLFPYSIHSFDIITVYPKTWFYIKIIFCFNLFISNYLIINSISTFFSFNKHTNNYKSPLSYCPENDSNLNLLIGNNPDTNQNIFITEKGLYQNILVTGTIGSR